MSGFRTNDREMWWTSLMALLLAAFVFLLFTEYLIPIRRGDLDAAWWTWMRVAAPLFLAVSLESRRRELRLREDALRRLQSGRL